MLWFCVLCLWSDRSELITLFMVCIILICGVFPALFFFRLVVVFSFPVPLFLLQPGDVVCSQALI